MDITATPAGEAKAAQRNRRNTSPLSLPDFATPEHICQAAIEAMRNGQLRQSALAMTAGHKVEIRYPKRGEPVRSDLAVTTACSLAYAVSMLNQ